jgi:hypothetical protein
MAKQGLKKGQVTAKRAYEMADSLMNNSSRNKYYASEQKGVAESAIKRGNWPGGLGVGKPAQKISNKNTKFLSGVPSDEPSGNPLSYNQRIKLSDKYLKQASADSTKAVRFRANADKAMAAANKATGRDTPLPSSDGIIGTITGKISELFK